MAEETTTFSRRGFLASAMGVGAIVPGALTTEGAQRPAALPIDTLDLDATTRADIEAFAEPVLREAARLSELPLDSVPFAFRFEPDRGRR